MGITIDRSTATAIVEGERFELSERSTSVLCALASGGVISRTELIRTAGLQELSQRRCESLILELRKALGPDSIVNVRRRGWMLTAPVEIVNSDTARASGY